ncbi:hypothetical protein GF360_01075 [candidate division WWE3 bacterium]|nr:hypothetical protein [candidate division WWE3 bacterium]
MYSGKSGATINEGERHAETDISRARQEIESFFREKKEYTREDISKLLQKTGGVIRIEAYENKVEYPGEMGVEIDPKGTLLLTLPGDTSRYDEIDLVEELIHIGQFLEAMEKRPPLEIRRHLETQYPRIGIALMEIEANREKLRYARELGGTEEDIRDAQEDIEFYSSLLEEAGYKTPEEIEDPLDPDIERHLEKMDTNREKSNPPNYNK